VEDSYDTRESIRIWLKQNGADVTAVESAPEALEALVPVRPHVLLSDIGLPGMSGYVPAWTNGVAATAWPPPSARGPGEA